LKKEVLDIVDQQQAPIPGADRNILANDVVAMALELVAEEGRGENEVKQPVNPATNTAANALANPAANASQCSSQRRCQRSRQRHQQHS
jgi:hypothetical protein